jgi:hypothetical protein
MLRLLVFVASLAMVPCLAHAQDTTHHDSSAVERKTNNTVNNAGEGVKKTNDQVDNEAYKLGTGVKNVFRPKKKKPPKPDSTAKADSAKRDSTPH